MNDALRLAVGTLTAVPVPPPRTLEAPVPARAMALAPVVGLVPGLAAVGVAEAARLAGLGSAVAAVAVLGCLALLTRGLHLDGLADTADGLAASYDRDRALAVMRRGDTGPAGLAAVVLVLLLQAAALQQVLRGLGDSAPGTWAGRGLLLLLAVPVAARVAIPLACSWMVPAARGDGLGATVAGSVGRAGLVLALLGATALTTLAALGAGLAWWTGAACVAAAGIAAAALLARAVTRLGGMTGDVLGAAVEAGTTASLLALAVTAAG